METATAAETTRRIVVERDIPEPAVAGLVEFIDRYYIKSKTRFIEPLSFRKTVSGTSFELFFIIGVYTVFVLISVQLVALIFSDKIVYRIGSVRPDSERPLVTIVSVRSNPETLKSIS